MIDKLCVPSNKNKICVVSHNIVIGICDTVDEAIKALHPGVMCLIFRLGSIKETIEILNKYGFKFQASSIPSPDINRKLF